MLFVEHQDQFALEVVQKMLKAEQCSSANGHLCHRLPELQRYVHVRSVEHLGSKQPFAFVWPSHPGHQHADIELHLNSGQPRQVSQAVAAIRFRLLHDPLLQHQLEQHPFRGSTIALKTLSRSGRVLSTIQTPTSTTTNHIITRLTGFQGLVTHYGTSWGAANTFEWLQTLKVAATFGTPAVFENYEAGTFVDFYTTRAMTPSFNMLGLSIDAHDLGWQPNGKFTQPMDATQVHRCFSRAGLSITETAHRAAVGQNIAGWYRQGMQQLGHRFLALLDITVPTQLISFESVLQQTCFWDMPVHQLALIVQQSAGHPVSLLHAPDGHIIRTNSGEVASNATIAQLHQQGFWLGGAAIYFIGYSLGQHGSVLQPISDGERGNVHLLAKPHLASPSQLWLAPVNLIWMPAKGQVEDGCIDPWVLLELFERWGEQRSRQIAQQLWELMEVPIKVESIGRKTLATISLDGLEVTIV